MTKIHRTPVRDKAKQISKQLKKEQPDYDYLLQLFRHIRQELNIKVKTGPPKNSLMCQQKRKLANIIKLCGSQKICSMW
mgnify:CR=1 FL=1